MMRRREFIAGLGAAAWPLAARGQRAAVPVIGVLHLVSFNGFLGLEPIRKGLAESGYVESKNFAIEYRFAENQVDRLPALAAELVQRRVAVILALGGDQSALAAKAATTTIPIVFATPQNPVAIGLVASFNRPGGNLTGMAGITDDLIAKRLELLHELVPSASLIAKLSNPDEPTFEIENANAVAAAAALKLRLEIVSARSEGQLEDAFEKMVQLGVGALIISSSATFISWRERLITLAARHRIPHASIGVNMSRGVGSLAMVPILPTRIGLPASMLVGFSMVKSRPTSPSCNRRRLRWRSTSRRQKPWVSVCLKRFC